VTIEDATETALTVRSQFTGRQGAIVFIFASAYDGMDQKSRYLIITIYSVNCDVGQNLLGRHTAADFHSGSLPA
jgi:hypothetical protein